MEIDINKKKELLYSNTYIYLIAFAVVMSWCFKLSWLIPPVIFLVGAYVLLFKDDITPIIPILILVPFVIEPVVGYQPWIVDYYLPAIVAMLGFFACCIYYAVIHRKEIQKGRLYYPLLAVSVACVLGGVLVFTTTGNAMLNVLWGLLFGAFMWAVYVFFYSFVRPKGRCDIKDYLVNVLFCVGVVVLLEFIYYLITGDAKTIIKYKVINLGWGISNSAGCLLAMAIPMSFYLCSRKKGWSLLYGIMGLLFAVFVIATGSRGSALMTIVVLPLSIIYALIKSEKKLNIILVIGASVLIFALMCYFLRDEIKFILEAMDNRGESSSGRNVLYQMAVEHFKLSPIFGAGFTYLPYVKEVGLTWYHSTFFQVLASFGIVGIVAFIYKYCVEIKILLKNDAFNIFLIIMFIAYEGYSLIDVMTFVPVPFMLMITIVLSVVDLCGIEKSLPVQAIRKQIAKCERRTRAVGYLKSKIRVGK